MLDSIVRLGLVSQPDSAALGITVQKVQAPQPPISVPPVLTELQLGFQPKMSAQIVQVGAIVLKDPQLLHPAQQAPSVARIRQSQLDLECFLLAKPVKLGITALLGAQV
jgi:hypothetical protein